MQEFLYNQITAITNICIEIPAYTLYLWLLLLFCLFKGEFKIIHLTLRVGVKMIFLDFAPKCQFSFVALFCSAQENKGKLVGPNHTWQHNTIVLA